MMELACSRIGYERLGSLRLRANANDRRELRDTSVFVNRCVRRGPAVPERTG